MKNPVKIKSFFTKFVLIGLVQGISQLLGVFSVITVSHLGTAQASHTLLIWALVIGLVSAGEFGSTSVWSTAKKNGDVFTYTDAMLAKLLIFLCLGSVVFLAYVCLFGGSLTWLILGLLGAGIQILYPTWYFSLTGKPEQSTFYTALPKFTQAALILLLPADPHILLWGWCLGCLPLLRPIFTIGKMQPNFTRHQIVHLIKIAAPMASSVSIVAYAPKLPLILASKLSPTLVPILSIGESIYQLLKSLTTPISQALFSINNATQPDLKTNRINKIAFWVGFCFSVIAGGVLLSTHVWSRYLHTLFPHFPLSLDMEMWLLYMAPFPLLSWFNYYYGVNGLIAARLNGLFASATLIGFITLLVCLFFFSKSPSLAGAGFSLFLMDSSIFVGFYLLCSRCRLLENGLYLSPHARHLSKKITA